MEAIELETVWVEWIYDEDPDLSWLGEYDRHGDFIPSTSEDAHVQDLMKLNNKDKHAVCLKYGSLRKAAQAYIYEAKHRYETYGNVWDMQGCIAYARIGITVNGMHTHAEYRSIGVWNIESDSSDTYKNDIEKDELSNLRDDLEKDGIDCSEFDSMVSDEQKPCTREMEQCLTR